jgi:hypothetical protein
MAVRIDRNPQFKLSGTLEVGYVMGGLGEKGFNMIQRVTLRTATNQFVLRLFPGTTCDAPLTEKPLSLVVDGVKGNGA